MQPPKGSQQTKKPAATPPGRKTRPADQPKPYVLPEQKTSWFRERKRVRITHVALLVLLALCFVLTLVWANAGLRTLRRELDETRIQLKETQDMLAEKERELTFSATDAYIEQQARERFGYIRPEEMRFVPEDMLDND